MAGTFPLQHPVATLDVAERAAFLQKVYAHLLLAIGAFVAFEMLLFTTGMAERMFGWFSGSAMWLVLMGGFMVATWLATMAAHDPLDAGRQYLGLFGLAAAQAVIFAPFLYWVFEYRGGGDVVSAAVITAIGFGGLSAVAFVTRRDLSFIRPIIMWGGVAALVAIVGAVAFGAVLGTWFSVAMIALAGGAILYQTQTIMRDYPATAYVGASVQLFASLMTMFWYVLRLVAARD